MNAVRKTRAYRKGDVVKLDAMILEDLSCQYGDAFYLLDSDRFIQNYGELLAAFRQHYPKSEIAYSYKTNYIPSICKIVDQLGGFAEVVSDMEMEIALALGVRPEKIVFNGPYKNWAMAQELLVMGGSINLDSAYELPLVSEFAQNNRDKRLNVGIRVNFAINDGVVSRFGFDVESADFEDALRVIRENENIVLNSVQLHYASRSLDSWEPRVRGLLSILDKRELKPECIDLGGGMYGKMPRSLKEQFDVDIPSYDEYALASARIVAEHYSYIPEEERPVLFIEPGTALVGDCMKFVSRVINIKQVRGKVIATLLGSIYNINPTLNKKNPPLEVFHTGVHPEHYEHVDFGGFTCIESDYLYRDYSGELSVGDYVVFSNVGSYSITLKPPFILPNFPVLDICSGKASVVKRAETFDDLFQTYVF